jgi:hypothetical protein
LAVFLFVLFVLFVLFAAVRWELLMLWTGAPGDWRKIDGAIPSR